MKSIACNNIPSQNEHGEKGSEQLKEGIQKAPVSSRNNPTATLRITDNIQRLGLSHLFEEEINALLEGLRDWDAGEDLFTTTLQFHLMRHNSCPTSSDVFKKYMNKKKIRKTGQ